MKVLKSPLGIATDNDRVKNVWFLKQSEKIDTQFARNCEAKKKMTFYKRQEKNNGTTS